MEDTTEVLNLIYEFAERFDAGDFRGALNLFSGGFFLLRHGRRLTPAEMGALWDESVILYDGRPLTRHVLSNPIIDFDTARQMARVRSVYTVFQATPGFALQPILAGRYHDRLARHETGWRLIERDYTLVDFIGDVSHHLQPRMAATLTSERD